MLEKTWDLLSGDVKAIFLLAESNIDALFTAELGPKRPFSVGECALWARLTCLPGGSCCSLHFRRVVAAQRRRPVLSLVQRVGRARVGRARGARWSGMNALDAGEGGAEATAGDGARHEQLSQRDAVDLGEIKERRWRRVREGGRGAIRQGGTKLTPGVTKGACANLGHDDGDGVVHGAVLDAFHGGEEVKEAFGDRLVPKHLWTCGRAKMGSIGQSRSAKSVLERERATETRAA